MNDIFIEIFIINFIDNKDIIKELFGNYITEESVIFELPSPLSLFATKISTPPPTCHRSKGISR